MVIAVSKLAPNYTSWLKVLCPGVTLIDLYLLPLDEAMKQASGASGILLSGGSDIHPALYGRPDDFHLCRDIDDKRDALEIELIQTVFRLKLPVLGICRGLQLMNVVGNGSLHADIPSMLTSEVAHSGTEDQWHEVSLIAGSTLSSIAGNIQGKVNSAHHQAIDSLSPMFEASAFSSDGLIEAIEIHHEHHHPFCMAVQWHPERMDPVNPLSGLVGKAFVYACRSAGNTR
ncbi:MAG: gamma-glutamyl-gamma-aminobutyrate hydrolase family protein [Bacteroidales bacterium]|nr:gamma-glutamyl-gamma-aminobutyrate hydrolase family protein [Bacteroidales bacterium]